MAQRFRILLLVVKKKKKSVEIKYWVVSRFSMPIENYNRRWYSQDKCPDLLNSPYQIMRWIFDQWYFGDRLFCENLWNRDHLCIKHLSINYFSNNWLSCGLWFQKLWSPMQYNLLVVTMFLLLCHIVKESTLLRKNGFIASNFLVL